MRTIAVYGRAEFIGMLKRAGSLVRRRRMCAAKHGISAADLLQVQGEVLAGWRLSDARRLQSLDLTRMSRLIEAPGPRAMLDNAILTDCRRNRTGGPLRRR